MKRVSANPATPYSPRCFKSSTSALCGCAQSWYCSPALRQAVRISVSVPCSIIGSASGQITSRLRSTGRWGSDGSDGVPEAHPVRVKASVRLAARNIADHLFLDGAGFDLALGLAGLMRFQQRQVRRVALGQLRGLVFVLAQQLGAD